MDVLTSYQVLCPFVCFLLFLMRIIVLDMYCECSECSEKNATIKMMADVGEAEAAEIQLKTEKQLR